MQLTETRSGHHAFLFGWGGALAVLLGMGTAILLFPVLRQLVLWLEQLFEAVGMSGPGAVVVLYWLQAIAIAVGVLVAVAGSDERMDRLRAGVGDWGGLFKEYLVVTAVVSLWVFASATWDVYVDVFNTYEASIELPMLGLLLLAVVASIAVRVTRSHRKTTS